MVFRFDRVSFFFGPFAILALFMISFGSRSAPAAGSDSITLPDKGLTDAVVGEYASLALDTGGNPVISYFDADNGNLMIAHCNDPACAGDDEAINMPVTAGNVGTDTALALDSAGNPVVSFVDIFNGTVSVLHCNDPNCAGDDDSITAPAPSTKAAGYTTSLALDANGYPVISYHDPAQNKLGILHCNDPNCAGNNDSIAIQDYNGHTTGSGSSLVLDNSGYPVVSFEDNTGKAMLVLHCNDANCTGGDDPINAASAGLGFSKSSLVLDGSGFPVISYFNSNGQGLVTIHCNDANCAGGNESITTPDPSIEAGPYSSLSLDGSGYPVAAYYDVTNSKVKVIHCNDANCAGDDESITSPDGLGNNGAYASLVLDGSGNPVAAYFNETDGDLKLLHCNDADCAGGDDAINTADQGGAIDSDVGYRSALLLDSSGFPVVAHFGHSNEQFRLVHCNDVNCAGGDESIVIPNFGTYFGEYASLALDSSDKPLIAYFNAHEGQFQVMHCNDANCAGYDEPVTEVNPVPGYPEYIALILDGNGRPVISYYDADNHDLRLLRCNDPECAGDDESNTSPDTDADTGAFSSLRLDSNGRPVISYFGSGKLKLLHCNDPDCAGDDDSITEPDPDEFFWGSDTALALDSSGRPLIAYYGSDSESLRIIHCNDPNCAGGDESIATIDSFGAAGNYLDLELDSSGFPVVSYRANLNGDEFLKVLHCNDPNCAGADDHGVFPDPNGFPGDYSSLVLDSSGFPVVSYQAGENLDLALLHCASAVCESFVTPTPTPTATAAISPTPTPTALIGSTPSATASPTATPTITPGIDHWVYLPVVLSAD